MAIQVRCYALGADTRSADDEADGRFPLLSGGEERGALRGDRMLRRVDRPTAHVYLPAPERERTGALVAICPGGGYEGVCIDKEGHDVARYLALRGIAAAVLAYRLPRGVRRDPSLPREDLDAVLALAAVNAAAWGVDPAKIGLMGFSAGGHLALDAALGAPSADPAAPRPAFAAAIYPVVSLEEGLAHMGSRRKLLGTDGSEELARAHSWQRAVGADAPPLFLVHSADDPAVPYANSTLLSEAYRAAGRPCRFVPHPTGGHGYGLGPLAGYADAPDWAPAFTRWLSGPDSGARIGV
jgi:acetyl esterase/lipase